MHRLPDGVRPKWLHTSQSTDCPSNLTRVVLNNEQLIHSQSNILPADYAVDCCFKTLLVHGQMTGWQCTTLLIEACDKRFALFLRVHSNLLTRPAVVAWNVYTPAERHKRKGGATITIDMVQQT